MKVQLLCVGKVKEAFYRNIIAYLEKNIKKKCEFTICQLEDLPIGKKAGAKEERKIKQEEGKELLRHIPEGAYVIALCIDGKELKPQEHKALLKKIKGDGYDKITYVIGGSLGLSDEVVARADYHLSFSNMTFPHQLMRVMLLEVIARDYL